MYRQLANLCSCKQTTTLCNSFADIPLHIQDQAPLQNRAPDWQLGSKGCYDAATLAGLQKTLAENLEAVADGNAAGCLSLPLPEATMQLLKQVRWVAVC